LWESVPNKYSDVRTMERPPNVQRNLVTPGQLCSPVNMLIAVTSFAKSAVLSLRHGFLNDVSSINWRVLSLVALELSSVMGLEGEP